jgi:hypothetical protein
MAFAASVGASACSSETQVSVPHYGAPGLVSGGGPNVDGSVTEAGGTGNGGASAVALYGAPAAGNGNGGIANAGGTNGGGTVTHYGAPSFAPDGGDAGPADAAGLKGAGGGLAPLYGGTPVPIYGAPPSKP